MPPKRLFNSKNNKKRKKKPKINPNASFPTAPSNNSQSYELKNDRQRKQFEEKLKKESKLRAQKQRMQHESFLHRQSDASRSAHDRIQELMGKKKKKRKKKKKKNDASKLKTKRVKYNKYHLDGAQFRWMNEMLYNSTSRDAVSKMKHHKKEFEEYHRAYNEIMKNDWPDPPLEKMIKSIKTKINQLSRRKTSSDDKNTFICADFGCGDAKLAKYFDGYNKNKNVLMKVKVHSFDLIALNEYVTECDISNVPLKNQSVDLVVFCLSLMGTNFHEFLVEAYRVLKKNGLLKITEVRSRIVGINKFEKLLGRCGFDVVAKDLDNEYFALFHCQKSQKSQCQEFPDTFDATKILKPCAYKKR